jgi:hypothetical protein
MNIEIKVYPMIKDVYGVTNGGEEIESQWT